MHRPRPRLEDFARAAAFLALIAAGAAHADTLLDQTSEVAATGVAPPAESSFTASTAQALVVTLTDLQQPAAFASLRIAVTLNDTVVGQASIAAGSTTATVALPATAGNYGVHVVGTPDATAGYGSFGVCVAPATTPSACIATDSFSATIQTPSSAASAGTGATPLLANFTTSGNAGNYTVTVTDDLFPVALAPAGVSGGLTQGGTPVSVTPITLGQTTYSLAAGTTYTLLLGALPDPTVKAGLYSIVITDPSGASVFSRTVPVGTLGQATSVTNPSAQSLQLSVNDLAFPAALASVGAAVTGSAGLLTPALTASGTSPSFTAPAGTLQIWQYAAAGSQPGVYTVGLSSASASLYSTTQVAQPANASGASSFAYVVPTGSVTAGTSYTVTVNDFQFPGSLQALNFDVAQNGTALTQAASSPYTFAAAAGAIVVVVHAQAPNNGVGLFSLNVAAGTAAPVLSQTQAVGGVLQTQTVNVGTSGGYNVTLTDLGFPSSFQNLAVVVSNGGQVQGKIYGGGTFPITATPGQYQLSFVATPASGSATAANNNYGLYSINISSAPPTVTFTSGSTSVTAGQPVQLTWSTTGATSCTAAGATGWSGSEPTSGSAGVTISAAATLTLTCTGPGGSAMKSVAITTTPAPSSGKGGGALDSWLLAILVTVLIVRRGKADQHTV